MVSLPAFRSLRAQLGYIFLGFLLLVGGSVVATFFAIYTQSHDALVINLAGRQRMLTQRITWLALAQPASSELSTSIQRFEQTLLALRDGGPSQDADGNYVLLPVAPDPQLRAELDQAMQLWSVFRAQAESLQTLSPDDSTYIPAVQIIQEESTRILAQLDVIVSAFEARARAKLLRLQFIQAAFFAAALALLAWGYVFTRRRILQPLTLLGRHARKIGAGSLAESAPPLRADELGALGESFEAMRAEIAAARDRLEGRVARRTQELTAAFEFSQEIVAQLDLGHLQNSVVDRACALMEAEEAKLCLLTADGQALELAASTGGLKARTDLQQPVGRGLAARVVGAGQTVVIDRACTTCNFLPEHRPGRCAAAPLHVGGITLGALCVVRHESKPFDGDETRALTLLANSAAIAIANARLVEHGQQHAQRMAALAERERLAAALHDNLAQTLSFIRLKMNRLRELLPTTAFAHAELDRAAAAIETAYGQVRALLVGLQEGAQIDVNDVGKNGAPERELAKTLATCLDEFRVNSGLPADLAIADQQALALPAVARAQVLHIVHEALSNVQRHAQASRVCVRVERVNGKARFSVEDDGCGFDPAIDPGLEHLGLNIMRTRAERSGGQLIVDSAPEVGTKIVASFPLEVTPAEP